MDQFDNTWVEPTPPEGTQVPPPGVVDLRHADNLEYLPLLASESFDLIYIDPPFNTGRVRTHTRLQTVYDPRGGDRIGYAGKNYRTHRGETMAYRDRFNNFERFLEPRLWAAHRLLAPSGSLFVQLDYREVHYIKVLLDQIFGRDCFMNEIIWAYDYGARARKKWSAKHDNILWYVKDPNNYCFNYEAIERIPYMAPGLVGPDKAARGKTPTDVWWHTIVAPRAHERTGYPTQKPLGILERIVNVHSHPGAHCLDFFAGSGSFGEAAAKLGRHALLIDHNAEAIAVMQQRLAGYLRRPGY